MRYLFIIQGSGYHSYSMDILTYQPDFIPCLTLVDNASLPARLLGNLPARPLGETEFPLRNKGIKGTSPLASIFERGPT